MAAASELRARRGQSGTGRSGRVGSDLSKSPNPLARERFGLFAMPGVIAIPNRPAGIGFGMLTRSGFRRQPGALVDTTPHAYRAKQTKVPADPGLAADPAPLRAALTASRTDRSPDRARVCPNRNDRACKADLRDTHSA